MEIGCADFWSVIDVDDAWVTLTCTLQLRGYRIDTKQCVYTVYPWCQMWDVTLKLKQAAVYDL